MCWRRSIRRAGATTRTDTTGRTRYPAYAQDKWQALPNLSITAGVRYDYHGGLTEKYGNMFNFDPERVRRDGHDDDRVYGEQLGLRDCGQQQIQPDAGVSDSTLTGRQWGISPRVGFAWSPKMGPRESGMAAADSGMYYDRGECSAIFRSRPAAATAAPSG